jgi:hypothetical protein
MFMVNLQFYLESVLNFQFPEKARAMLELAAMA